MRKKLTLLLIFFVFTGFSQKIKIVEGDLKSSLKGVKNILVEFEYDDNLKVGKKTEKEYIEEKVAKYNEKEAGKGDKWLENWKNDRKERYEPKFMVLFNKVLTKVDAKADTNLKDYDAKIVIHTYYLEPGFNVGISSMPAAVSFYVTAYNKKGEKLFKLDSIKMPGSSFSGGDFDAGVRIRESYAKGAKTLASFLIKKKAFK